MVKKVSYIMRKVASDQAYLQFSEMSNHENITGEGSELKMLEVLFNVL